MTTLELRQAPPQPPVSEPEYRRLARRAKALSWASLAYMGAEGAVALTAGFLAASPALVGFGIDSAIESVASLVIIWRFTGARLLSDARSGALRSSSRSSSFSSRPTSRTSLWTRSSRESGPTRAGWGSGSQSRA